MAQETPQRRRYRGPRQSPAPTGISACTSLSGFSERRTDCRWVALLLSVALPGWSRPGAPPSFRELYPALVRAFYTYPPARRDGWLCSPDGLVVEPYQARPRPPLTINIKSALHDEPYTLRLVNPSSVARSLKQTLIIEFPRFVSQHHTFFQTKTAHSRNPQGSQVPKLDSASGIKPRHQSEISSAKSTRTLVISSVHIPFDIGAPIELRTARRKRHYTCPLE